MLQTPVEIVPPVPAAARLPSVQPRLCCFDQGLASVGRIVDARSFGETAVVIHNDSACASRRSERGAGDADGWKTIGDVQAHDAAGNSTLENSHAIVRHAHENVILLERRVVK